jgi:galactokinase
MIPGYDDPQLGEGAPLGDLAAARHPLLSRLSGHWSLSAPGSIASCARALLQRGNPASAPARAFVVPGRIEVLGKHTDYAGGRSLLAAVERGFTFVSVTRPDEVVHLSPLDLSETAEFPIEPGIRPRSGWVNYPMTVVRRVARDFPHAGVGIDLALRSDLPPASGMSSSSALVIGTFLSLAAASGLLKDVRFRRHVEDLDELASYLAAVESGQGFAGLAGDEGVGTHGGSEDHTAILRARAGTLLQYRFVPATFERAVAVPEGYRFAIAASGIEAAKTGAMRDRYNRASALARALRDRWLREGGGAVPSLAAALRSSPDAAERLAAAVRGGERPGFPVRDLLARLEHLVQESESIVPAAASALAEGRLERFGQLVDESQRLAETLLGNQVPETVALQRRARELGAVAASAFGAGYGGSVWALVQASHCDAFLRDWRRRYAEDFAGPAARATFFSSAAGPPAQRVA